MNTELVRTPCQDVSCACYGLEQSPTAKNCRCCALEKQCRVLMGNRAGAVPLSEISYHPSGGKCTGTSTETGPEFICDDYAICYQTIFHSRGDEALALPHFATKIVEICHDLNMSSRMFMLANMYGFSRSSPDRHFNAKLLLMPRAKQRATLYRHEVTKCYGTFDVSALKQYADDDGVKLDPSYLDGVSDSEQLAARWIAGYKQRS